MFLLPIDYRFSDTTHRLIAVAMTILLI